MAFLYADMGEPTARDRVWTYALTVAVQKGKQASPGQIAEMADVSERVARSCLFNISEAGFLERIKNPGGKVYYERPNWVEIDEKYLEEGNEE
jgi:predicted transcriptional regulator